ncbi:MAG: VOC family protein [Bacteroidetes bacterium]|nr:VOC family protein [Bacteroidota bacterium]
MSNVRLFQLSLLVRDYDEAIQYYTNVLGFQLIENTILSATKRWVVVSPNPEQASLLLAKAATPDQEKAIGNQSGGRVFLFLHTDNFETTYNKYLSKSVEFVEQPRIEMFGKVCVFKDLYGNLWDLIEPIH